MAIDVAALRARFPSLHDHENVVRARVEEGLRALGGAVTVHSGAKDRTPTVLMSFEGRDAREAQAHPAARDVVAPAGSFYAHEAFTALKLDDAALRVGLAPYNDTEDVDRLLDGLASFL
ncbi:aminotransferase class V-fold PLP-dependent enzyme [Streptomyces sp. NPDC060002]|uniref:aminotransferase class V-fold PLP-dependent enzyme n=1 Tax=Streptomyces sp. NPDC060002 TaxID=3347033 RepID=UPI0036A419AF